jgi:hypothetical protein
VFSIPKPISMFKSISLTLGILVLCTIGYAQSQGPNNGATFVSTPFTGSIRPWNNPGNAITSNGQRATTTNTGGGGTYSEYLNASNFGFSVPAGATILGIVVAVQRDDAQNNTRDHAVRIVKNSVIGATDKALAANWPTTEAYQSYGSSTDLWGETWTPADINNANFGFVISARKIANGAQAERINHIQITVHFSITLPVNITHFTASRNAQSVSIEWKSGSEKNLSHYEIERSSNGIDFVSIGHVPAQQKTIEPAYSFTDNQPINGNAYYRLKAVDENGQFIYSVIAAITFKQTGKMQLYPNPLPKGQSLFITNTSGEEMTINLFSPSGALIETIRTNKNNITLSPAAKKSGAIFYTITNRTGNQLNSGQLIIY